jgi:hypothetical protein
VSPGYAQVVTEAGSGAVELPLLQELIAQAQYVTGGRIDSVASMLICRAEAAAIGCWAPRKSRYVHSHCVSNSRLLMHHQVVRTQEYYGFLHDSADSLCRLWRDGIQHRRLRHSGANVNPVAFRK